MNLSKEVLNKYREVENKAVKKYISENTFLKTNLVNRENKINEKNEIEQKILDSRIEREQNTRVEKIVGSHINHINKKVEETIQRNMSLVSKSISNVFNKSVNNENWLTQKLNEEFTSYKSTNLVNFINKFNPETVQREITKKITNISKRYNEKTILKGSEANPLILNSRYNSREYYNEVIENIGRDFVVLQSPGESIGRPTSSAYMEYKKPISLERLTTKDSPEVEEGLKLLQSRQEGAPQDIQVERQHYGGYNKVSSGPDRFETKQLVRECIDEMADEINVNVDEISRQVMNKIERMLELERKRYGITR